MKGILAAFAVAVVVVGFGRAEDKKLDAAKLVGKWELTKSTDEGAPKGAIVEFMKDSKLTITFELGGKKIEMGGTYKLDGDKLTVTIKPPDGGKEETDTDTIKTFTDDMLVLIDKDKKETEFTKKK
jgi:uncharacterized protein (TIGR03066 family)